jgi:hypothetical protein
MNFGTDVKDDLNDLDFNSKNMLWLLILKRTNHNHFLCRGALLEENSGLLSLALSS